MNISYMQKVGRLANSFESDHGKITHGVIDGKEKALCGTAPGKKSVGWMKSSANFINCEKCLSHKLIKGI